MLDSWMFLGGTRHDLDGPGKSRVSSHEITL
jgi:hypothetical protein